MMWNIRTFIATSVLLLLGNVSAQNQERRSIQIAGIMDTENLQWSTELWDFTIKSLQEDWLLDLYPILGVERETLSNTNFTFTLANGACDPTTTVRSYWKIREDEPFPDMPPHALIGAYCSGSSMALATIAGLEEVVQVSHASTSSELSDKEQFPFFLRMLAPDNHLGEVGALVSSLRMFGWKRVSIMATDLQFAKDWEKEFRNMWTSQHDDYIVEYSTTIRTDIDEAIDLESARQAIAGIPTKHPEKNSRVILLAAHSQHAFPILEMAHMMQTQPDTIWVGPSSWIGKELPSLQDNSWIPPNPGFLGAIPFQNVNGMFYKNFLQKLQDDQRSSDRPVWNALPSFGPQLVDAIVAMTTTLCKTPTEELRNGTAVWNRFREMTFEGVGGKVQFSSNGDLDNPRFSIRQLQGTASEELVWETVGLTGNEIGSASPSGAKLCFPEFGCVSSFDEAPSDSYASPRNKIIVGTAVAIGVICLVLVGVLVKYWRSRKSKTSLKQELDTFRDSIVGMRTATTHYIPLCTSDVEQALPAHHTAEVKPQSKIVWCWQETDGFLNQHEKDNVFDAANRWVKYADYANLLLESAYQNGDKECNPLPGYVVDMKSLVQTKLATQFTRKVRRLVIDPPPSAGAPRIIDFDGSVETRTVPKDLASIREPKMVLVEGDIVQISKQRQDGWAFGTKLHHADEAVARELVAHAVSFSDESDNDDSIFPDTGWFPLELTTLPSRDDLWSLQKQIGDSTALQAPSHWDPVVDPTIVQYHKLPENDPERRAVVQAFQLTIQKERKFEIVKVERIQNLAMWQSYVVKRQTICCREVERMKKANSDFDESHHIRRAMERFERCWLWHGTDHTVKDKILQQGFNRSFCGKNAVLYGKGVYFARDASYSSHDTYSVPDNRGRKHVIACRVAVGEYCIGVKNALTPDIRDPKSQSLFDSTVGLLRNDTMANPSIYVTYHDAQAYPEVREFIGPNHFHHRATEVSLTQLFFVCSVVFDYFQGNNLGTVFAHYESL
jgi:ABC-type branched-subunit amino acid transport system substrate-binding protein